MRSRTGGLVVAAAFWAASVSGTKYALGGFGPLTLLGLELVVAAATLWLAVLVRGRRPLAPWRHAIVLGLLEPGLAYLAETVGLQHTSAANASIIAGFETVFVVVLAALFLGERITTASCSAVLLGLLGLMAMETADGLSGPGTGDVLVLAGALSAAAYTIVARHMETTAGVVSDVDSLTLTAQQFLVSALAILPFSVGAQAFGSEPSPHAPARFWLVAVAVGIAGFAASFLLYNGTIAHLEARTSAIVLNLIPVFGVIGAVAWLGERPGLERYVGAGLITTSVAAFTMSERRHPDVVDTPVPAALGGVVVELPAIDIPPETPAPVVER